jgi:hypothetical protein
VKVKGRVNHEVARLASPDTVYAAFFIATL